MYYLHSKYIQRMLVAHDHVQCSDRLTYLIMSFLLVVTHPLTNNVYRPDKMQISPFTSSP